MKLELFFATNPVFTIKDLKSFLGISDATSTFYNLLQYHQKKKHILLIRRGIYAVIPKGTQGTVIVDPYLIASKLKDDSILAYKTALALHEKSHTMVNRFYYLTFSRPEKNFEFQGNVYQAVSIPSNLKKSNIGVIQINRMGLNISLTSLERTFVDILDRPYLCLSWEEISQSIENIEFLDSEAVLEYTFLIGNRTTAAIVGFFLDMYREKWMIPLDHLKKLKKICPNKPIYLKRSLKGPQKLISSWNLIVPQKILEKKWEEPHEDI
jgi:predicted transcriptional regulator of viral defense system